MDLKLAFTGGVQMFGEAANNLRESYYEFRSGGTNTYQRASEAFALHVEDTGSPLC